MKKTKFKVPIFGWEIWVIVASDMKDAIEALPAIFKSQIEPGHELRRGLMCYEDPFYAVLFDQDSITTGLVHHEVEHMFRQMAESAGYTIRPDNDEIPAMIEEYLNNEVTRRL